MLYLSNPPRSAFNLLASIFVVLVLSTVSFGMTFTVTKTADTNDGACDADCSFRAAVAAANAAAGDDSIVFDGSVFGTAQTINLTFGGTIQITGSQALTITGTAPNLLGRRQVRPDCLPTVASDVVLATFDGGNIDPTVRCERRQADPERVRSLAEFQPRIFTDDTDLK